MDAISSLLKEASTTESAILLLFRKMFLMETFSDEISKSRPSFEIAIRLLFLLPFYEGESNKWVVREEMVYFERETHDAKRV